MRARSPSRVLRGSSRRPHSTQRMPRRVRAASRPAGWCRLVIWRASCCRRPSRCAIASGLDPRVRVERAQHPPDVVADGVGAEVQLVARSASVDRAAGEQVQDLVLARCEVRMGLGAADLSRCVTTPNTPTIRPPSRSGHGADLDLDALAVWGRRRRRWLRSSARSPSSCAGTTPSPRAPARARRRDDCWRPRMSPTSLWAAALIQRMTPSRSTA